MRRVDLIAPRCPRDVKIGEESHAAGETVRQQRRHSVKVARGKHGPRHEGELVGTRHCDRIGIAGNHGAKQADAQALQQLGRLCHLVCRNRGARLSSVHSRRDLTGQVYPCDVHAILWQRSCMVEQEGHHAVVAHRSRQYRETKTAGRGRKLVGDVAAGVGPS